MSPAPKLRARPRTRFAKAQPRLKRGSIKLRKGNLCEYPKAKGLSIRANSLGKIVVTAAAGHKAGRRVNRLPEWTDKRSYITKGKRHRLFGEDYHRLRWAAYMRSWKGTEGPFCECGCGFKAWWGLEWDRGELSHNEHGGRKSDELSRVKWMRHGCHMKRHNCGGKPITVTKKSLKEKACA